MKRPVILLQALALTSFAGLVLAVPPASEATAPEEAATVPAPAQPTPTPEEASLGGNWYEVAVECPFCPTFETQTLALGKDATRIRFSDRIEVTDSLKSVKFISRGRSGESITTSGRAYHLPARKQLILVQYAEGDDQRSSDNYARLWVLSPLGGSKLLYGRRYLVSAFSDEAFEEKARGFKARDRFLPPERLLGILEDVRVYSLNEARKLYQPSAQVRFTLEGAVAFVREGTEEADVAQGKEEARKQNQERASREALFKTLVQQGDQAYTDGNFEDALNRYKAASAILPDIALVHADLGAVYHVQNKLPEAEASYRLALELDPNDLDTQFNLAQVYEQSGRFADALKLYRQVLEKRPQDAEAKERVSRLSQKLKQ